MKYTINELANSKGVSQLVREGLLQMEAELEATNRQVEILSDALAESRREVAALKDVQEPVAWVCYGAPGKRDIDFEEADINKLPIGTLLYTTPLEQPAPVQEPVAWLQIGLAPFHDGDVIARTSKPKAWNPEWWRFEPLYTTPTAAQRQWVGLTDEERNKLWRDVVKWGDPSHDDVDLIKAIEAKLKEKNHDPM